MAIDDRCLQSLIRAGVDKDEAEDHLGNVQRRMVDYKKQGLSDADTISKATQDALNEESLVAQRQRVTALMNLHKRMDVWTGVSNATDALREMRGDVNTKAQDMYQAIRSVLVGVNRAIPYGRKSLEADMQRSRANIIGGFLKELGDTHLSKLAYSGKFDEDIAKELAGIASKNGQAKMLAGIYKRYGELSKTAANSEGAWIGELKDYIARNEHDWQKISDAGYAKWKADINKTIDPDKTFAGMDKPRIDQFLKNTYNALVSGEFFVGGKIGMKDPAFTGPANIAKAMSKERVLHFTDEGWYQYWQKYGTSSSLAQSIQNTISSGARDSSLMHWFGTNPEAEFKDLLTRMRQEFSGSDPEAVREFQDKYEKPLQNRFDQLSGRGNTPANSLFSSIGSAARAFENIVHLGFVPFAHVNIAVTRALNAHHWGDSALGQMGDVLTSLFTSGHANTEEGRELLDLIGARNNGMISHIVGSYDEGLTGLSASLSNLEMKATGLSYLMNAQRKGDEFMLSHFLGRNLDKGFDELHPRTQSSLRTYGIMKEDWEALRGVADPAMLEGKKFLTPDMALRSNAANKEELQRTLASMFGDSSRRAMNIPGAEAKVALYKDLPFGGQLGRAVMQFKQWPTELMLNAFGRTIYDNPTTQQKMLGTFALAAGLTAAGYIRLALINIAKGEAPPQLNGTTVLEAAQAGGAGMVMGDALSSFIRQHQYDEAVASVGLGPIGKDVYDLGKMGFNAMHGQDQMKNVEEFGLKHIPFQNIWYLHLLTNYNFLWALHEQIHPGWSQRYDNYVQQDTGSKPFISPTHR